MTASSRFSPSAVRYSPNIPSGSSRPSRRPQQSRSSRAIGIDCLARTAMVLDIADHVAEQPGMAWSRVLTPGHLNPDRTVDQHPVDAGAVSRGLRGIRDFRAGDVYRTHAAKVGKASGNSSDIPALHARWAVAAVACHSPVGRSIRRLAVNRSLRLHGPHDDRVSADVEIRDAAVPRVVRAGDQGLRGAWWVHAHGDNLVAASAA